MIDFLKQLPLLQGPKPELVFLQRMSLFAILMAYLLPVFGMGREGYSICWIYNTTSLPCPGCGLTRSVISLLHLDFSDAWFYHPFGLGIGLAIVLLALSAFIRPLSDALEKRIPVFRKVFIVFFIFMVCFGAWRLVGLIYFPEYIGKFEIVTKEHRLMDLF